MPSLSKSVNPKKARAKGDKIIRRRKIFKSTLERKSSPDSVKEDKQAASSTATGSNVLKVGSKKVAAASGSNVKQRSIKPGTIKRSKAKKQDASNEKSVGSLTVDKDDEIAMLVSAIVNRTAVTAAERQRDVKKLTALVKKADCVVKPQVWAMAIEHASLELVTIFTSANHVPPGVRSADGKKLYPAFEYAKKVIKNYADDRSAIINLLANKCYHGLVEVMDENLESGECSLCIDDMKCGDRVFVFIVFGARGIALVFMHSSTRLVIC